MKQDDSLSFFVTIALPDRSGIGLGLSNSIRELDPLVPAESAVAERRRVLN